MMRSPFEIFCMIVALVRDLLIVVVLAVVVFAGASMLGSLTPSSYCASWEREQGRC